MSPECSGGRVSPIPSMPGTAVPLVCPASCLSLSRPALCPWSASWHLWSKLMSSGWGFPEGLWELGSQTSLKADRSRLLSSQTALKIVAIIPAASVTCPSEISVLHKGLHPTPQLDNSNDEHLQQSSRSPLLALAEKLAFYPFALNSIRFSVFCESCS